MPLVLDAAEEGATERAAELVADRGLVVVPLDGVYALVGDAFAPQATSLLRSLRGAAPDLPVTLLVRGRTQLAGVTSSVPEPADRLIAAFWPGPLTLILPAAETMAVDLGASHGTVAVRMPAGEHAQAVVAAVGPLACSSAAPAGQEAPTEVSAAVDAFGGAVHAYLDAGELEGVRSTVVGCSRGGMEVRRRGAISADDVLDAAAGAGNWAEAKPAGGGVELAGSAAEAGEPDGGSDGEPGGSDAAGEAREPEGAEPEHSVRPPSGTGGEDDAAGAAGEDGAAGAI
jgi:tRNA threonylcarbamoyl adenosine modification protein (Sua5/YciO/YrdC/YwlC family)